ncbi:MAG TPA: terminase family protein [candidate division Zixibacteria bacterium]|nr:terminase family protein [candidate division Zixibacteria bacterium]
MLKHFDWVRGFTDPAYFASEALGVTPHPGQERWLSESNRRENLLVTGNRWGKSFVSALKVIHHAIYRPRPLRFDNNARYRIVTASITQDQAAIIFNQVVRFVRQTDWLSELVTGHGQTPYPHLEFGNGSLIEARSTQNRGQYLLGQDYDLFLFDEVAFETDPEYVVEEVIAMRLADRAGRLDLISTPNGKNWFYRRVREVIDNKRPGYFQSGDSRENSHISADYLDDRVKYFSDRRLQQNIMGQFVDTGGEIIPGGDIDRALDCFIESPSASVPPPLYLSGWDLARKRTATVGVTVAVHGETARIVKLERMRRFDWNIVIDRIKRRQEEFPGRLIVDATGLGDVVVEQLAEFKPEAVIFNASTKAQLLANVELFHARGNLAYERWELPDGPGRVWSLEDELRAARWDDNNECDALMALALALWPLRKRSEAIIEPRLGRISRTK